MRARGNPPGARGKPKQQNVPKLCLYAHSGEGEDFLMGQLIFFTKTGVTPERKVEKSIPRWEINRHSEGYKWVIDQNWGCITE